MSGAQITFNGRAAMVAIHDVATALDNAEPLMRSIGEYLLVAHNERWDAQVSPDGIPWAPLSPRYKNRKAKERPGAKLLVFDNLLRGTLRYQPSADQLLFGTDRPYGARQHFGDGGDGGIPARPWLGTSQADDEEILAMTQDYLMAVAAGQETPG